MKKFGIWIFGILFLTGLTSCGVRQYVRLDTPDALGFQFFLFADLEGNKVQANGDAVLIRNESFRFRLYDNLLNKYVMSYKSGINGKQTLILPLDKTVLRKYDAELSDILIKKLYTILKGELINSQKDGTIKDVVITNNQVQSLRFQYADMELSLDVLRRFKDGRPRRFRLMSGEDYLIFDIIKYQPFSFNPVDLKGYSFYQVRSEKPFLKWIGEVYGGK